MLLNVHVGVVIPIVLVFPEFLLIFAQQPSEDGGI